MRPNVAEMPDNEKMSISLANCNISALVTEKSDKFNNSEELLSATNSDSESGKLETKTTFPTDLQRFYCFT